MRIALIATLLLACALTFAGCGKSEKSGVDDSKAMASDGTAQGVLTINGKDYPLKYVYTGMEKAAAGEESRPVEILVTNEPVPQETLKRIALELGVGFMHKKSRGVVKSESLKGIYFYVDGTPRYGDEKTSYNGYVITSDDFFDADGDGDINFNDKKITAKVENEIQDSTFNDNFEQLQINAKFSVSFDADIKDETLLSKSLSGSQPPARLPDEGKANGAMTISDRDIDLKYAYALREKPVGASDEGITVLITDDPVPKESLLYSFERAIPGGYYGLYLYFDPSGNLKNFTVKYPSGFTGDDNASVSDLKLENGKITGSVRYKSEKHGDSYSVTFDAPLKD